MFPYTTRILERGNILSSELAQEEEYRNEGKGRQLINGQGHLCGEKMETGLLTL